MTRDDRFDWDDGNRWKIEERFDLEDVEAIFGDDFRRSWRVYAAPNEQRWGLLGATWDDRVLHVVYTRRGAKIRVISARRATDKEQRAYWERRSHQR